MSIFKQKKSEPKKDLEAQLCATCGHYFKKDTGYKRKLKSGKKNKIYGVYWFCKDHKPNWDYVEWGQEMTPGYREHLERAKRGKKVEWVYDGCRYTEELFYYQETPDKKIKPNYKINL